jgi:RimJ/RimL family protein N-acetyltransferase
MSGFPLVIETARLILRPSDPACAEVINAAIRESFPELQAWLPWADHLPEVAETRAYLADQQDKFLAGTDCSVTLWLRASGLFVGTIGLHPRPMDPAWREIGYWLHSRYTRQGLATEAVKAVAEAGFAALALAGIQIKTSERNVASQRVAERAGFVREAVVDDGRADPGGYASRTVLYARRKAD